MDRKRYHVVHEDDQWKLKLEGAKRASAIAETKAEIVERGREVAGSQPRGQLIIHKKNGVIQTEHTYGADPERYPG